MAIYRYKCPKCGHEEERRQKPSAEDPPCPKCETRLAKQITKTTFALKGGAWASSNYS